MEELRRVAAGVVMWRRQDISEREWQRASAALKRGEYRYMRKCSREGCPLVYISGIVFEEVTTIFDHLPHSVDRLGRAPDKPYMYVLAGRATRRERNRFGREKDHDMRGLSKERG